MRDLSVPMLQPEDQQSLLKLSFNVDPEAVTGVRVREMLLRQHANLTCFHEAYLDVLPIRAPKGQAMCYLAYKWGMPLHDFLVAGDSGNDVEMLIGDTRAIVVSNHSAELEKLRGLEHVYFAGSPCAFGIIEGIDHYGFGWQPESTRQPEAA